MLQTETTGRPNASTWKLVRWIIEGTADSFVDSRVMISSHAFCPSIISQINSYRALAEFELSMGDYESACKVLHQGAENVARSDDGGFSKWKDLAKLYILWATCEWHNGNLSRAEVLFNHALRTTNRGEEGAELRSFILYSMARFEFSRGNWLLAQHCIGVCMKENVMPLGKSKVWELWAQIASALQNSRLREECLHQAEVSMKRQHDEHPLLGPVDSGTGELRLVAERNLFRRDPWQIELFGFDSAKKTKTDFYSRVESFVVGKFGGI